ncbi:MAG: hypothetical protein JWP69_844 [Flaviaesturariibacter sp.]|nr:hypothetical protein [Flaviaesturariibacter sp.]
MNFINKAFLRLALLPSPLYKNMGVSLPQLRAILTTKLTMDDRRVNAFAQVQNRKKAKPMTKATLLTMLLSAFMGLFFLLSFSIGKDIQTQLTFYFSMFFFMLSATLISDFTSVLIDVRDTFIILPKPVSDRTFVLARLLHIFIHICKLVLPMSLPGLIFMGVEYSIGGALLLLLLVLLVTLFSIFFINAVYILILKITTPERFKSIIAYFQIGFAVVMYASYQVFPRLIGSFNLENFSFTTRPGIIFYPFYWFASCWNLLHTLNPTTQSVIASLLAIIVPIASIYIVVRYLAPSFNNRLAMINGGSEAPKAVTAQNNKAVHSKRTYSHWLSAFCTRTPAERMGFRFTWKLMSRNRDFKLKVYPSIGYLLVYGFIMIFRSDFRISGFRDNSDAEKGMVLSMVYFTVLILTTAISQVPFSDKYKAAWFYYTSPLVRPGDVVLGGMKAALLKFYIPIVAIVAVAATALLGIAVLPNIILGFCNQLLIASFLVYINNKLFPFSMPLNNNAKAGSFLRVIIILVFSGLVGVGHYLVYDILPVIIIFALLSGIATWMLMSSIRATNWVAIKSSYTEE